MQMKVAEQANIRNNQQLFGQALARSAFKIKKFKKWNFFLQFFRKILNFEFLLTIFQSIFQFEHSVH